MKFRKLKANEIELRHATLKENGVSLLLYKDARVDQNILDETVGIYNWQRKHTRENANCIVSIWDSNKGQWIEKEDTGKESFSEAEKGLASDSFKRACFNWGIGRELYSAPFIWISSNVCDIKKLDSGKLVCNTKFKVSKIGYDDNGEINELQIVNLYNNDILFNYGKNIEIQKQTVKKEQDGEEKKTLLVAKLNSKVVEAEIDYDKIYEKYNVETSTDMTIEQLEHCIKVVDSKIKKSKTKGTF